MDDYRHTYLDNYGRKYTSGSGDKTSGSGRYAEKTQDEYIDDYIYKISNDKCSDKCSDKCPNQLSDRVLSTIKQRQFMDIQQEQLDIFIKKNNDYGNGLDIFGSVGIMIRLQDKLNRYINLNKDKTTISLVKDESITDTLMDLSNYSNLLIMSLKNSNDKCIN